MESETEQAVSRLPQAEIIDLEDWPDSDIPARAYESPEVKEEPSESRIKKEPEETRFMHLDPLPEAFHVVDDDDDSPDKSDKPSKQQPLQSSEEPKNVDPSESSNQPESSNRPENSNPCRTVAQEGLSQDASLGGEPAGGASSGLTNLGNSLLTLRASDIGGRVSKEDKAQMLAQQWEMSKSFYGASRSIKDHESHLDESQNFFANDFQPRREKEKGMEPWKPEEEYRLLKERYTQKIINGENTQSDEIEWMKAQSRYDAYQRSCKAVQNDGEGLFVGKEPTEKRTRKSLWAVDSSEDEGRNNTRRPSKKRKTSNARPKKGKRGKQKQPGPGQRNHRKLAQSDMFEDADAAENMNLPPVFAAGTNRENAFNELLRNVPEEQRAAARLDVKHVKDSMGSFRKGRTIKPAPDGRWKVQGIKTSLTSYQIITAGFVRKREQGEEEPRGGIVADTMGLGKTMVAIAIMVNGRPCMQRAFNPELDDISQPQTTLIIMPTTLLKQWEREISAHCEKAHRGKKWGLGPVKVFRHKDADGTSPEVFCQHDVVLTSYWDVMCSWPEEVYPEGLKEEDRAAYFVENFFEKRGPLHMTHWHRVILDEGHEIRNPNSRRAKACFNLNAIHHLVLTGTPMFNGVADLYSLFQFIKHPTVLPMSHGSFKQEFCDIEDPMSSHRLSEDLSRCMSRFTHADTLFAARLVTLPGHTSANLSLSFSPLEREIYEIVRRRFQARAKSIVEGEDSQTKAMHVFALITRLRQLTAHPLMIQSHICEYLEREDFERLESAVRDSKTYGEGEDMIIALREIIQRESAREKERTASKAKDAANGTLSDDHSEGIKAGNNIRLPADFELKDVDADTGKAHGLIADFSKYIEAFRRSQSFLAMNRRSKCVHCSQHPDQPLITSCFHLYCEAHLQYLSEKAIRRGRARPSCVECGDEITSSKRVVLNPPASTTGKKRRRIQPVNEEGEDLPDSDFEDWTNLPGEVLPSTKTIAVKSQILEWLDPITGDPDAKIIIFTQWIGMIRILSKVCETEQWDYTTLHGGLSQKRRDENITEFKSKPGMRILIASLKVGGVGLNLVEACRVINVDPYWNSAGEQQAFGRVYRIGQQKETKFLTLRVENSIDDRLTQIKSLKDATITEVIKNHKRYNYKLLLQCLGDDDDDSSSETRSLGETSD